MANYVTEDELFHFVGRSCKDDDERYELLTRQVLGNTALRHDPFTDDGNLNGVRVHYQDGEWLGSLATERHGDEKETPIFQNIVCLADIPRDQLSLHMSKYSQFGISLSKSFVAERRGRPVMYFPVWPKEPFRSLAGHTTLSRLNALLKQMFEGVYDDRPEAKRAYIQEFCAFLKPFDVTRSVNDPENYYTEREWRVVGYLNFALSDVMRVILPGAYHPRFKADFPQLADKVEAP